MMKVKMSRGARWLAISIVALLTLVLVFALLVSEHGPPTGFSGGTILRAEPAPGAARGLPLDADETAREQPALARLLDDARTANVTLMGKDAERAVAWLDARAHEAGAAGFRASPFVGVVEWKGELVRLSLSAR